MPSSGAAGFGGGGAPTTASSALAKVTPSPTLLINVIVPAEREDDYDNEGEEGEEEEGGASPTSDVALRPGGGGGGGSGLPEAATMSLGTPYPGSPNPARLALGNEKGTPDSVIRPTVLTYRGEDVLAPRHRRRDEGDAEGDDGGPHHPPSSSSSSSAAAAAKEPFPDGKRPSPSAPDRTLRSATAGDDDVAPAELCGVRHPVDRRGGEGEGGSTEAEAGGDAPDDPPPRPTRSSPARSKVPTSEAPSSAPPMATASASAPPAIQNGTLAAASALMTLLGKERGGSPQG